MTSFWHPSTNQFLFLVLWHAFSYVCQPCSQSLYNKGLCCNIKKHAASAIQPIPTIRDSHIIYCHSKKSYPYLVGIGLRHLSLAVIFAIWMWNSRGTRSTGAYIFSTCGCQYSASKFQITVRTPL